MSSKRNIEDMYMWGVLMIYPGRQPFERLVTHCHHSHSFEVVLCPNFRETLRSERETKPTIVTPF